MANKPKEFWVTVGHYPLANPKHHAYPDKPEEPANRFIEYSAYEKLKEELKMVREIGVEGQRNLNDKLSAKKDMLVDALHKIAYPSIDAYPHDESPAGTYSRKIARQALADLEKVKL